MYLKMKLNFQEEPLKGLSCLSFKNLFRWAIMMPPFVPNFIKRLSIISKTIFLNARLQIPPHQSLPVRRTTVECVCPLIPQSYCCDKLICCYIRKCILKLFALKYHAETVYSSLNSCLMDWKTGRTVLWSDEFTFPLVFNKNGCLVLCQEWNGPPRLLSAKGAKASCHAKAICHGVWMHQCPRHRWRACLWRDQWCWGVWDFIEIIPFFPSPESRPPSAHAKTMCLQGTKRNTHTCTQRQDHISIFN